MEYKRLNKAIAETGYCSRREADKYIEERKVLVNGEVGSLGVRVTAMDEIRINGKRILKEVKPVYLVLNKPIGITCTTDLAIRGNIISFINYPERIFPVGRLDKPSEGLILLTNDGDIVNKILRAHNHHEKEYIVTVNKRITKAFIEKMSNGIPILDTVTNKCKVKKINEFTFNIVLTQGLNRQIRRMCEFLKYDVQILKRVRIMNILLGDLPVGKTRSLTSQELNELFELIKDSDKTGEITL